MNIDPKINSEDVNEVLAAGEYNGKKQIAFAICFFQYEGYEKDMFVVPS